MTITQSPLDEAAAFFDLFLKSDWASCHVRGEAVEIFVAREPGHANPMLGIVEAAAAHVDETMLTAPHLGTLVELAAIGTPIAPGERYGVIELLGESIDLIADRAGTIGRHVGRAGALVEFEDILATLH